jgi:hypothetical protein
MRERDDESEPSQISIVRNDTMNPHCTTNIC